jgi:hypothetical protein
MERFSQSIALRHFYETTTTKKIVCVASPKVAELNWEPTRFRQFRQSQFEHYLSTVNVDCESIFIIVNSLNELRERRCEMNIDELILMVHGDENGNLVFGYDMAIIDDVMMNFNMKRHCGFINIRLVHCFNHKSIVSRYLNRSLCLNYEHTTKHGGASEVTYNVPQYIVDTSRPKDNLLSIHSGLNPEIMRNERVKSFVMNENLAKSNSTYRHEI